MLPRRLLETVRLGGIRSYHPKGWKTPQVPHEMNNVIKWVEPENLKHWAPQRTCDLYPLPQFDLNALRVDFRPFADIINKLPEDQRKLFTVKYSGRNEGVKVIREDLLSKIRRHDHDDYSIEVKIANATINIRNYQDQFATFPNVKKSGKHRALCYLIISQRHRLMTKLRIFDYKRFEWIIEVLGVLYKTRPAYCRVEKRASLNVLVAMFCNEMRDRKMAEYKKLLDAEKVPFLEMKLATLLRIREDEESIKMPSSVDEDIKLTHEMLENFKKLANQQEHLTIHPVESTKQIA